MPSGLQADYQALIENQNKGDDKDRKTVPLGNDYEQHIPKKSNPSTNDEFFLHVFKAETDKGKFLPWKFHISIAISDSQRKDRIKLKKKITKLWGVIYEILLHEEYAIKGLKICNIDKNISQAKEVSENYRSITNTQITIYIHEGDKPETYEKLFYAIKVAFDDYNAKQDNDDDRFRPSMEGDIDAPLQYNPFVSMRNENDEYGFYISANDANSYNPTNAPNPFHHLIDNRYLACAQSIKDYKSSSVIPYIAGATIVTCFSIFIIFPPAGLAAFLTVGTSAGIIAVGCFVATIVGAAMHKATKKPLPDEESKKVLYETRKCIFEEYQKEVAARNDVSQSDVLQNSVMNINEDETVKLLNSASGKNPSIQAHKIIKKKIDSAKIKITLEKLLGEKTRLEANKAKPENMDKKEYIAALEQRLERIELALKQIADRNDNLTVGELDRIFNSLKKAPSISRPRYNFSSFFKTTDSYRNINAIHREALQDYKEEVKELVRSHASK